jgi:hypothetical protein
VVSSWVMWVSRLIALEIFPSHRIRVYFLFFFLSVAWCLELAAFCLRTAAWVDVYPSSLLPISCVSITSSPLALPLLLIHRACDSGR